MGWIIWEARKGEAKGNDGDYGLGGLDPVRNGIDEPDGETLARIIRRRRASWSAVFLQNDQFLTQAS